MHLKYSGFYRHIRICVILRRYAIILISLVFDIFYFTKLATGTNLNKSGLD